MGESLQRQQTPEPQPQMQPQQQPEQHLPAALPLQEANASALTPTGAAQELGSTAVLFQAAIASLVPPEEARHPERAAAGAALVEQTRGIVLECQTCPFDSLVQDLFFDS